MDKFTKILIPTDFSPAAWQAVHFGLSMTEKHGAEVSLLHVFPSENKYMSWLKAPHVGDPEVIRQLNKKLETFTEELRLTYNSNITQIVISGNVTNEILNFARINSFDLIIIGVNSGSFHNTPGSNTSEIIQKSGIPVLVVPGVKQSNPEVATKEEVERS